MGDVPSDHRQAMGERSARDQDINLTNRLAEALEIGPNGSRPAHASLIKREHLRELAETLKGG